MYIDDQDQQPSSCEAKPVVTSTKVGLHIFLFIGHPYCSNKPEKASTVPPHISSFSTRVWLSLFSTISFPERKPISTWATEGGRVLSNPSGSNAMRTPFRRGVSIHMGSPQKCFVHHRYNILFRHLKPFSETKNQVIPPEAGCQPPTAAVCP